jgi:hypothetical protein
MFMTVIFARIATAIPYLLWIMATWQFAHAGIHMDTARDWTQAARIASGDAYPLAGPGIAHAFHLGPIWFYVLALPLWLGLGFSGVGVWTAFLSGSQYLFAFWLGKRFAPARAEANTCGAVFALSLTLPNWSAVHMGGTTHTIMAAPMLLAALFACVRFWDAPSAARAFVAGVTCSLAVHGHPTTGLVFVLLLGLIAAKRAIPAAQKWQYCALSVVGFCVLFVPLLFAQFLQNNGGAHLNSGTVTAYVGAQSWLKNLQSAPQVLFASVVDTVGVQYAMLGDDAWLPRVSIFVWFAAAALALRGWAKARAWGSPIVWIAIGLSVASVVGAAWSRPFVTFYMLVPITVLLPLMFAYGWGVAPPRLLALVAFVLIALQAAWAWALVVAVKGEGLRMDLTRVVYVGKPSIATPWVLQPNLQQHASNDLVNFLCANKDAAFHGPAVPGLDLAAWPLLHSRCASNSPHITLGGSEPARAHWVGAPCHALASPMRTGSVCWQKVARVVSGQAMTNADTRIHPPRTHAVGAMTRSTQKLMLNRDEVLIVSNHKMEWSRTGAILATTASGQRLTTLGVTPWYRIFQCKTCGTVSEEVDLIVESNAHEAIDVVVVSTMAR